MLLMKEDKKDIEIFFIILREQAMGHKDIDHILPLIYFLNQSRTFNYKFKGILFENELNFKKNLDPRVKFLFSFKNLDLKFLYRSYFMFRIKQFISSRHNSIIINLFKRVLKFYYKNKLNHIKKKFLKHKLKKYINASSTQLLISLHQNKEAKFIVSCFKKINKKAKWVVAPHGTIMADNKMLFISDLDKKEKKIKNRNSISADFILNASRHDLQGQLNVFKKNSFVVGLPRYCEEWLKLKSRFNLDGKKISKNNDYKVRVLFLMPKRQLNIFFDELFRTIDFISSYKQIDLILLDYDYIGDILPNYLIKRSNVRQKSISTEYSTSKLIDWSDIVFHVGTSMLFEFLAKNKIAIFPRYLTCNTLISEKYNVGYNLRNRDELRDVCNEAVSSLYKLKKKYKNNFIRNNKKFINDFVNANSKSVKVNLLKAFSKIGKNL